MLSCVGKAKLRHGDMNTPIQPCSAHSDFGRNAHRLITTQSFMRAQRWEPGPPAPGLGVHATNADSRRRPVRWHGPGYYNGFDAVLVIARCRDVAVVSTGLLRSRLREADLPFDGAGGSRADIRSRSRISSSLLGKGSGATSYRAEPPPIRLSSTRTPGQGHARRERNGPGPAVPSRRRGRGWS